MPGWEQREEIEEDGFPKAKCFTKEEIENDLGYNLDQCGYPHKEEVILEPMELISKYQEERAELNAEIDEVLGKITEILNRKD